jgi:hypothetical protein
MGNTRNWTIGIVVFTVLALGYVVAQGMWGDARTGGAWGGHAHPMGAHGGWTGSQGMGHHGTAGMMGGMGMMGGAGMMGGMGMMEIYPPGADPTPEAEALRRLEAFGARFGSDVRVADVMAFSNHYYAQLVGPDGVGLAEVLVDRYTGTVQPEPGPNMMWRAGGGMGTMGGMGMMYGWQAESGVRYDQAAAEELAAEFLAGYLPGAAVLHAQAFAGYYTIDFGRDAIEGMLSVHAASGEVWVHSWHGPYLGGHD